MNIQKLTDNELNRAMIWLNPPKWVTEDDGVHICDGGYSSLDYLTDWSLTGPLMRKYEISLINDGCTVSWAGTDLVSGDGNGLYMDNETCNTNPLRAICECVLAIHLGQPR